MSTDYRYFPTLAIPGGTAGQILTKTSNDPDNGAQWSNPQAGTGPAGPAGPAGPVGPAGATGSPGSQLLTGSGAPGSGLGAVGDFYVDSATNNAYQKTGPTTWTLVTQFGPIVGESNQFGSLFDAGFGSMSSRSLLGATSIAGMSGTVFLTYSRAPQAKLISNISMITGAGAAGATPTLVRFGVYTVDGSGNLTLAASTTNDTSVFAAAVTRYTRAASGSLTTVRGNWYAHALLVVSAAAMPSIIGNTSTSAGGALANALSPRLSGLLTGQTDLPASITAGSVTITGSLLWAELT